MTKADLLGDPKAQLSFPQRMAEGKPFYFTWSMMPGGFQAGALARGGLEGVLIDMQHGLIGYRDMVEMIEAIYAAGSRPIVRPPLEDFSMVSRALDAGAQGIVFPMVNTPEDARKLAAVANFPPMGERSWGAYLGMQKMGLAKDDYIGTANGLDLVLGMIETQAALDNLEDICAVEGLNGVFVGPNDLSISLTAGKSGDVNDPAVQAVLPKIAEAARKAGKTAGIFVSDINDIPKFRDMGYSFMNAATDVGLIGGGLGAIDSQLA